MSCSEGVGVLMAFQKGVIYTKQLLQNLILSRNSQDSQTEIFELINANFSLRDKYAEAQQQGAHHAAPGLHGRFLFTLSLKLSFSFFPLPHYINDNPCRPSPGGTPSSTGRRAAASISRECLEVKSKPPWRTRSGKFCQAVDSLQNTTVLYAVCTFSAVKPGCLSTSNTS